MANKQVTGTVVVLLDGMSLRSKVGASLDIGGWERQAEEADGEIIGFRKKKVPAMCTATLAHTSESELRAIDETEDATLVFETDTGVRYTVRNAFSTRPPKLTGGEGEVSVEFQGQPAKES